MKTLALLAIATLGATWAVEITNYSAEWLEFSVPNATPGVLILPPGDRAWVTLDVQVTTRPVEPADMNGDGCVDAGDMAIFDWAIVNCYGDRLDLDRSGAVDAADRGYLGSRMVPTSGPNADLDGDGDVDVSDFTVFQNCMNGPNRPPRC